MSEDELSLGIEWLPSLLVGQGGATDVPSRTTARLAAVPRRIKCGESSIYGG